MQPYFLQRIHVSWLIASWCLGVVAGIISLFYIPQGTFLGLVWLWLSLVLLVPTIKTRQRFMIFLVLVSGCLFGLWRGSLGQVGLENYELLFGQTVKVAGRVAEDPDISSRGQTVLRLQDVKLGDDDLPGSLWVTTTKNELIKRSDNVTIEGKINRGFGSFAGSIYDADILRVERPVPGDVAVGVRDWFAERVKRYLPETESALGLGFLLGLRRALPTELVDVLKIAGLTHVIVASGYNLTILVRLSRRLFVRVSKYLATLSSIMMILGFIAITGMSPSMSRAGLVAGLSLATWYYGRKIHPFVLLPLVGAITLLINPAYGWNNLGWQLSFASFVGVIVLAPLLQRYFFGEKEPGNIRQIFGETFSAQLMTLPILVLSFGVMSNVALVANVLILPFVPLAMLLVFLIGIFAGIPLVASLIALPTQWLLGYMVSVSEWLAGQSWAQTELLINWWQVMIAYILISLAVWWMIRQTGYKLKETNIVE